MESVTENFPSAKCGIGFFGILIVLALFVAFMFLPGCTSGYGAGEEAQAPPPSATPSSNVVPPALGATTTVI